MPSMRSAPSNEEDYNRLFAKLKKAKVWGTFTFQFKDGEVKKITYQRDFLGVGDVLHDLDAQSSQEEQPRDESYQIRQNGTSLPDR